MDFTTLITVEDLNQHLDDPGWAIFDVRFDLQDPSKGLLDYLDGHIPGSLYAHLETDLSLPASPEKGRHPLPPVEALAQTFSRWGIDDEVQVVAYDDRGGGFAARLWWILRYLGHSRVAVLDGGFPAWIRAGMPTHKGQETRSPRQFEADIQGWMLAQVEEVLQRLEDEKTLLVDSRAPERYQGIQEPIDRLAGHIPGAVNRFWQHNLDEELHLLPKEILREQWEEILKGRSAEKAILYCGSGVTACANLLAMAYAGLESAKLYAGSWSQWLEDPKLPKVLGPQEEKPN